ncbi:MAG TPA: DoxX family protein [bacterium]
MTTLTRLFPVVGRLLLSSIFVLIGVGKLYGWNGFAQYMDAKHLPAIPVLLTMSIAVEIAGGSALLVGWRARSAALLLIAYLVPVTLQFHNFWALTDAQAQVELVNFLKNIAIMGGLLMVAAFGPGPFSVDSWLRRRANAAPAAKATPAKR